MPITITVSNSPVFSQSSSSTSTHRVFSVPSPSSISPPTPSKLPSLSTAVAAIRLPEHSRCFKNIGDDPVCSSRKRRPASIKIPISSLSFESAVRTPREVDRLDEVVVEGEGYSVYCKRGKRGRPMEDRHSALVDNSAPKQAFFGIFDGHGGAKAAEFAAKNMGTNIINEVSLRSEEGLEEAIREGYLNTDAAFLNLNAKGGTSCVTSLIRNGMLVLSNAGDCRAVMCRGGVAETLTVDHRPSRKDERERIESLGGYVDCCRGVWRIQGSLAVSRGLGDSHLKRWVIAEPETRILRIEPQCEFLILASDGLWDKVNNQEAVEVVRRSHLSVGNAKSLPACKDLVDLAIVRGSSDDISAMVIQLGHFAK